MKVQIFGFLREHNIKNIKRSMHGSPGKPQPTSRLGSLKLRQGGSLQPRQTSLTLPAGRPGQGSLDWLQ